MSKLAVVFLCGVLAVLAGCATPEEPLPPDWSATNQVAQAGNPAAFKPIPGLLQTNRPAGVRTNLSVAGRTNFIVGSRTNLAVVVRTNTPAGARVFPAPMTNPNAFAGSNVFKPPTAPIYTWTSLKRWAVEQKIEPPSLLAKSPLVTYAISSPRGVMLLSIGSQEAAWNGVIIHLGYAPEIIDGEVYVHGLDLQTSFAPFLCAPRMSYGTNRLIVIDPGHGGINAGALSVLDHRPEKEFTLDWARRLQPLLEQEGWQVVFTRTNDVDIALSNRVTVAESWHADLFLSLHFNSLPDTKPIGLATYCITPTGLPSTITRGYPDILSQSFPNNSFDTQNVQLAEQLQRSLLHATGLEDRGVNRARFMGVLRGQRRPAVLIEAGFLSNPREARRIATPEYRQTLAEAVAAALK